MAAEPVPKSVEFGLVFRWVLLASARGAPSEISGSAAGVPELKAHPHIYSIGNIFLPPKYKNQNKKYKTIFIYSSMARWIQTLRHEASLDSHQDSTGWIFISHSSQADTTQTFTFNE